MLFIFPILSHLKALRSARRCIENLQELQPEYSGIEPKVYLPERKKEY